MHRITSHPALQLVLSVQVHSSFTTDSTGRLSHACQAKFGPVGCTSCMSCLPHMLPSGLANMHWRPGLQCRSHAEYLYQCNAPHIRSCRCSWKCQSTCCDHGRRLLLAEKKVGPGMRWSKARDLLGRETRYRALPRDQREPVFTAFVSELKARPGVPVSLPGLTASTGATGLLHFQQPAMPQNVGNLQMHAAWLETQVGHTERRPATRPI